MARSLCRRILAVAQNVDAAARISAVTKVADDGGTLVRVRADGTDSPSLVANALRAALPLSVITLVENVVEGTCEAQVLLPELQMQRAIARSEVRTRLWAVGLALFAEGLLCAAVGVAAAAILARSIGV